MAAHATPTLTAERLRELLDYDPETGRFTWRVRRGPVPAGGKAGGRPDGSGYSQIRVDGRLHLAHRLAWLYMTGDQPPVEVDHRDTDPMNNRWSNLRASTRSGNNQNVRRARRNNSSGYLGVSPRDGRWLAQIHANGKKRWLGLFDTPELAHGAYLKAKAALHPDAVIPDQESTAATCRIHSASCAS